METQDEETRPVTIYLPQDPVGTFGNESQFNVDRRCRGQTRERVDSRGSEPQQEELCEDLDEYLVSLSSLLQTSIHQIQEQATPRLHSVSTELQTSPINVSFAEHSTMCEDSYDFLLATLIASFHKCTQHQPEEDTQTRLYRQIATALSLVQTRLHAVSTALHLSHQLPSA